MALGRGCSWLSKRWALPTGTGNLVPTEVHSAQQLPGEIHPRPRALASGVGVGTFQNIGEKACFRFLPLLSTRGPKVYCLSLQVHFYSSLRTSLRVCFITFH